MRNVSSAITNAIENNITSRVNAKVKVFASRYYFKAADITDNHPTYAHANGSGNPLPEAMEIARNGGAYTVVIDNNQIKMLGPGNSTGVTPLIGGNPIASDGLTRPGIMLGYIFYWDGTNWKTAAYDTDKINNLDTSCISSPTTFCLGTDVPKGAIYPLNDTDAVILYIDEGAVRAVYVSGSVVKSTGRFFYPSQVMDESIADINNAFSVHFGGAVEWLNPETSHYQIFVYFTRWNGLVSGMYYDLDSNIWSEIFTVIPEDISNFLIGNIFIDNNNKIWICGRFTRRSDFASASAYTMLCWSTDGKNFSMDRRTLVTTVDYRWLAAYSSDQQSIDFSATNRWIPIDAPYQFAPDDCYYIEYHLRQLSGSPANGWSAYTVAGEEYGFDDEWLDEGSYAQILIGIFTGEDYEWIPYQDCVVSQVQKDYANGTRSLQISLMADGLWHTYNMTYPIYTEIDGKQYLYSPLKVFDTLYVQTGLTGQPWALTSDPWTNDVPGQNYTFGNHAAGASNDIWGPDLTTYLEQYPIFAADTNYAISVYGWSRAGVPSQNPNVADSTPTNTNNDKFYAMMLVQDLNGNQITIVATDAQLTSTYANPPQTYFPENVRDGSDPVTYTLPSPGNGWQLIKLGVRVVSDNGNTTYVITRFEMPGIIAGYTPNDSNPGFVISNNPSSATPQGITVPWNGTSATFTFTAPNDGVYRGMTVNSYVKFTAPSTDILDWSVNINGTIVQSGTLDLGDGNHVGSPAGLSQSYGLNAGDTVILTYSIGSPVSDIQSVAWVIYSTTDYYSPTGSSTTAPMKQAQNTQKGIPQILFATEPYSAWNFDIQFRANFTGPYSYIGGIGLATDNNNFLIGYVKRGYLGIAKVQNQKRTIVYEIANEALIDDTDFDVRFWHRDGVFGVEFKTTDTVVWPDRGSMLTYSWTEPDGIIASVTPIMTLDGEGNVTSVIDLDSIDAVVYHVGIYSIIDPPKFKTSGFANASPFIPVAPLDINPNTGESDFLTLFPDTGQVSCGSNIYLYTSRNQYFASLPPQGPYEGRAALDWTGYNKDKDDGTSYAAWKRAIEFVRFAWLSDAVHHDDFDGALIAMDDGQVWQNAQTFYKPWVTTGGVVVFELERGRYYSETNTSPQTGNYTTNKIWITHGLTGVTPASSLNYGDSSENSFVYLDNSDQVTLKGFMAVSGDEDMSIGMLMDKICRVSGTLGAFPGDTITNATLSDGQSVVL